MRMLLIVATMLCSEVFAKKNSYEGFIFRNSRCYTVQSKSLNIRNEPALSAKIATKKYLGEEICAEIDNGIWIKTKDGWAKKEFLDFSRDGAVPR